MTTHLMLTTDELLTTTRSVRKRLDLTRPVERELLEECLQIAQQAPTQSNMQNWRFVVVTDPDTRAGLGRPVPPGAAGVPRSSRSPCRNRPATPEIDATNERILEFAGSPRRAPARGARST